MLSKQTKIVLALELLFAFYMILSITMSEFERYKVEKYIMEYEQQNLEISLENQSLLDLLDYYSSPEYRDKIAKQNLGLVLPGEKVLVIPESHSLTDSQRFEKSLALEKQQFFVDQPNYKKWLIYFFGY